MPAVFSDKNASQYPILASALAFGAGMVLGAWLIFLLLVSPLTDWFVSLINDQQPLWKVVASLLLFLFVVGLGGATAGAWGGLALSRFSGATSQTRFIWRGALSFFLAHAIIIIPAIVLIFAVSFFNPDIDVSQSKLPRLIGLIGLLYGLVSGLLFGLLTGGLRRFLWVTVAAIAGFGLGGLLLGFMVRLTADWQPGFGRALGISLGVFLFGAAGGALLGFIYGRFKEDKGVVPDTTFWMVLRVAVAVFLVLLLGFTIANLFELAEINIPDLDEQLTLATVSTHWLPAAGGGQEVQEATTNTALAACVEGRLSLAEGGSMVAKEDWAPCYADPQVAEAGDGRSHAIWYSDEILRQNGGRSSGHFLLESILDHGAWTDPAIIAQPSAAIEPQLASDAQGTLYLSWNGGEEIWSMTPYSCDERPTGTISQVVYDAVRSEQFWNPDDPITHCGNRFDRLHYTPNPAVLEQPFEDTPLGAFDTVGDLVRDAEYEVLFVTMQWDAPSEFDSPGDAMARAIADLHAKVQANPENYPRGMTVRILLGNLPETTVFSFANQLHHVITDLREAGINTGGDPDTGWRIELADYTGSLPHAHSKFLVVDGKTAVAAGFNYSYLHLDESIPYELTLGMTDMGLQITGPVAQSVMAAYDDLWRNSELIECPLGYIPRMELLFVLFCRSTTTEDVHTPEVLRFYPVGESDSSAFALHHTLAHLESDEALLAAIGAARESIDLFEVNFSLESLCLVLSQVSEVCTAEDFAPPYMLALRDAVIENDVRLRVMMEESAMNGLENRTGVLWLQKQLEEAGKLDNIDLRFSGHKMHNKAMLVDEEFLSVGSQNFHFSAWGSPSLTEYNMATDDPAAINEFQKEYEYWWAQAVPVDEIMEDELQRLSGLAGQN